MWEATTYWRDYFVLWYGVTNSEYGVLQFKALCWEWIPSLQLQNNIFYCHTHLIIVISLRTHVISTWPTSLGWVNLPEIWSSWSVLCLLKDTFLLYSSHWFSLSMSCEPSLSMDFLTVARQLTGFTALTLLLQIWDGTLWPQLVDCHDYLPYWFSGIHIVHISEFDEGNRLVSSLFRVHWPPKG